MNVTLLPGGVCAEINGVDLSGPFADEVFSRINEVWLATGALLIRGQSLTDEQLLAFAKKFGDLEFPPSKLLSLRKSVGSSNKISSHINVISNVVENGQPIGQLGAGEASWHTDSAFVEEPPAASVLYAIEIPSKGGNTSVANMTKAWDSLDPVLRDAIRGKNAKHDYTYTSVGERRKDFPEVLDPREAPGPTHPIVRTHPDTGRESLYLGRRLNCYIMGLSLNESEKILDRLWKHAVKPEFTYEHVWQVGDVLMWDNRCTMHRREAFDKSERRIMHRAQVKGGRPYFEVDKTST
ncbi:MAG: TauD/TfdA family dioxygenase [Pseudomonadota bacterium]|nr:TauD/TfdA family dioxygenase [Pseudomonadota bacterium]